MEPPRNRVRASAPGRNMSACKLWELSVPVDDDTEQRVDLRHREWDYPVFVIKVCAAKYP